MQASRLLVTFCVRQCVSLIALMHLSHQWYTRLISTRDYSLVMCIYEHQYWSYLYSCLLISGYARPSEPFIFIMITLKLARFIYASLLPVGSWPSTSYLYSWLLISYACFYLCKQASHLFLTFCVSYLLKTIHCLVMFIYASLPLALGLHSASHLYAYLWHGILLHRWEIFEGRSGWGANGLDVLNAPAVFDASISRAEPRWRIYCWSYCWIIEGAPRWGDYSLVIFNPRFCVCPQDRLRHACFNHHHDHTLITYVWLLMTTH
jgi:hypothetical protein